MASGWFQKGSTPQNPPDFQVQIGDREPNNFYLGSNNTGPPTGVRNVDTAHSIVHVNTASLFDVGILKDTLAPSLGLHSGLAVVAWAAARYTGRVEAKDWLWPSGQVVNAWWSAVGRKLYAGLTLSQALHRLSWHERLILTGVTLWGGRLFYRIASRSIKRGKDDPRYEEVKEEENFWNKSLFTTFIPEAFFQMLISLPFTAPFRHEGAVLTGYHPLVQMIAVGLFSTGLALETLADYQLDKFKAEGGTGILKEGVWSIVRHPKYASPFEITLRILMFAT
jgi:steroid 5-alpha reductase family enzyme